MKARHLLSIIAAAAASFAACQKPVDLGPEQVAIDSDANIEIPAEGQEFTVNLTATVDWALQGYTAEVQEWLSISPESGKAAAGTQTVTVKALKNEGADRSASIVFYGNILCKAPLTITQKGPKGVYETITVAEFLSKKDTATEYALKGTISDVSKNSAGTYWGLTLTDETGSVACPFIENWDEFPLKNGDKITIKGKYSHYASKDQDQLANGTIVEYEAVDTPKGEARGSGTLEDPFNATAANAKCAEVGSTASSDDFYVKGKISSISDLSTSFGNATFYISDNGTTAEEQFYVFRAYYLDGAKFTSSDQIKVGDEVVVKGKLINYGDSTPELNQGGQIVSINGKSGSGDGGDGGEGGETVKEPSSATKVSIKEFLAKSVNTTDWYELTGTIKSIAKADYGNLTIEDESGSVYVYGIVKAWAGGENDKSFSSLGLKVTDVVTIWTLRAEYNGTAQAGGTPPAIYKSHTAGAGETYPAGSVVLSFPDENQSANKANDYVSTWTAKIGSNEFTIANFNNYQWKDWTYIKCGRKNDASVASIYTQTPIAAKVAKLQLTADSYDASSMNSLTLNVYSDAAKTAKVLSKVASDPKAGVIEFAIDADKQAAGLYYELVFDCKVSSASKNGFVQISKVVYLAAE